MASTITRHSAGTGAGAYSRPLMNSQRTIKMISFDLDITSYATGGEDISSVINELGSVVAVIAQINTATPGAVFQYDPATKKLKAFWTGAALSGAFAEVASTTDLNQARVLVIGY